MAAAGSGGGGDIGSDSERRLKKAMDKLYHFPKPKSSSTGSKSSSTSASAPSFGRAAADAARRFGVVRGSRLPPQLAASAAISPPPPCRPWDRADLMRRLASFKAMTWFAKPKAISPVNCARRGWTNIEPDVITCEACGARLLFSSPSSWTTQQVEKAAAVFSLKLDTGHKLLCPWIDNICDESLALFPPTPPPVLVENYYECFSSLLRLSALPSISSSSLEIMKKRTPQLEQFLSEPFSSSVILKGKFALKEDSEFKDVDDAFQDANTYYQALKIISLCGWEPRVLSYAIDCGTKSHSDANSTSKLVRPEQTSKSLEDRVILYSPNNDINRASASAEFNQDDEYYDPLSVVLDCQFCGACVALWPFSLVERPLQLFNLVSDSRQDDQDNGHASLGSGVEPSKSANIGFNFTIAGGPPPTRQSFRPKVSFPIVSRHLKADLNSRGIFRSSGSDTDMVPGSSHTSGPLKRKRIMDQQHMLEDNTTSNNVDTSTNGTSMDQAGDYSARSTKYVKVSTEQKQGGSHTDTDKGTNVCETSYEEATTGGSGARKCAASTDAALEQQGPEPQSPPVQGTRVENSDVENLRGTPANNVMPTEVSTVAKSFVGREKEKQGLYDRLNEFDPIKQHRTFCPWIAPDDGESLPGWRLTLSALLAHDKRSDGEATVEVQTNFLDEEDDPLTSVRNLFMSLPPKRLGLHQSEKS